MSGEKKREVRPSLNSEAEAFIVLSNAVGQRMQDMADGKVDCAGEPIKKDGDQ